MKKILNIFSRVSDIVKNKAESIRESKRKELEKIEKMDDKSLSLLSKKKKKTDDTQRLSTATIMKFWLIGAVVLYIGYVVFQSLDLIYLILASFIISIAMEMIIEFFHRVNIKGYHMPRGVAVIVAYLLIAIFVVLGMFLIIPFVVKQGVEIIQMVIEAVSKFQTDLQDKGLVTMIQEIGWMPVYLKDMLTGYVSDPQVIAELQGVLQSNIGSIVSFGKDITTYAGGAVVSIVTGFFSAIIQIGLVFILAIFFSLEKDKVVLFLDRVGDTQGILSMKLKKLYKQLGFWLKGQLMLSLFIGVTVFVVLHTLSWFGIDLPNKITLALIAGITEFVPIIGPILGAVPAVLLAILGYGFPGLVIVGLAYYVIQWFENNVLIPLVMNQALGISPLVIFLAMMVGASVLGFIGVVLSVPLAVIVTLMFENIPEEEIQQNNKDLKSNNNNG